MTKAKRCLPGISKWNLYAGGTSCREGKHNYDLTTAAGKYSVSCVSDRHGRPRGYIATVADIYGKLPQPGLHAWIRPDGTTANFPVHTFRSPAAAAKAADAHCQLVGGKR